MIHSLYYTNRLVVAGSKVIPLVDFFALMLALLSLFFIELTGVKPIMISFAAVFYFMTTTALSVQAENLLKVKSVQRLPSVRLAILRLLPFKFFYVAMLISAASFDLLPQDDAVMVVVRAVLLASAWFTTFLLLLFLLGTPRVIVSAVLPGLLLVVIKESSVMAALTPSFAVLFEASMVISGVVLLASTGALWQWVRGRLNPIPVEQVFYRGMELLFPQRSFRVKTPKAATEALLFGDQINMATMLSRYLYVSVVIVVLVEVLFQFTSLAQSPRSLIIVPIISMLMVHEWTLSSAYRLRAIWLRGQGDRAALFKVWLSGTSRIFVHGAALTCLIGVTLCVRHQLSLSVFLQDYMQVIASSSFVTVFVAWAQTRCKSQGTFMALLINLVQFTVVMLLGDELVSALVIVIANLCFAAVTLSDLRKAFVLLDWMQVPKPITRDTLFGKQSMDLSQRFTY